MINKRKSEGEGPEGGWKRGEEGKERWHKSPAARTIGSLFINADPQDLKVCWVRKIVNNFKPTNKSK